MNEKMERAIKDLITEALVLTIQEVGMSQEQGNIFLEKFAKNIRLATQIVIGKGGKA